MKDEEFRNREMERANRLVKFVKDEIRDMWVEARFRFTIDIFDYLTPELRELIKKDKIKI